MRTASLTGSLELLFSDGPVLDLYAQTPWRVPDGLIDELSARIDGLIADPRSARLTVERHPVLRTPTPAVVADVLGITAFLLGDGAVRSGRRCRLDLDIVERFRAPKQGPACPRAWAAPAAPWRPASGELFRVAGNDRALRELAWELTEEILRVLEGIAPIDLRREGMLALFEQVGEDGNAMEAVLTTPRGVPEWFQIEELWTDAASDQLLQLLPELTGPVGYLSWIVDGWLGAYERLAEAVPGAWDHRALMAELLLQAGAAEVPAELAVGARGDLYTELTNRLPGLAATFQADVWRQRVRAYLARALVAGQVELARAFLDLSVRFTAAVQGTPGTPAPPEPCLVPVTEFQADVRRLFRVRQVRHPLSGAAPEPSLPEDVAVRREAETEETATADPPAATEPGREHRSGRPGGAEIPDEPESAAVPGEQLWAPVEQRPVSGEQLWAPVEQHRVSGGQPLNGRAAMERPGRAAWAPVTSEEAPGAAGSSGAGDASARNSAGQPESSAEHSMVERPTEAHPTEEGLTEEHPTEERLTEEHPTEERWIDDPPTEDAAGWASDVPPASPEGFAPAGLAELVGLARPEGGRERSDEPEPAGHPGVGAAPPSDRGEDEPVAEHPGSPAFSARDSGPPEPLPATMPSMSEPPEPPEPNESYMAGPETGSHGTGDQETRNSASAGQVGEDSFGREPSGFDGPMTSDPVPGWPVADRAAEERAAVDRAAEERAAADRAVTVDRAEDERPAGQAAAGDPDATEFFSTDGSGTVPNARDGLRAGKLSEERPHERPSEHVGARPTVEERRRPEPEPEPFRPEPLEPESFRPEPFEPESFEPERFAEADFGEPGYEPEAPTLPVVGEGPMTGPFPLGETPIPSARSVSPPPPGRSEPPAGLLPGTEPGPTNGTPKRPGHGGPPSALSVGDLPGPERSPERGPERGPDGGADRGSEQPPEPMPDDPGQRIPAEPDRELPQAHLAIDGIIGQGALTSTLHEIAGNPDQEMRLLVAGPPGTGRGLTVDVLTMVLTTRGLHGGPIWIGHEDFARLGTATAVAELRERLAGCQNGQLVVIDGLDRLVTHGLNGRALAEELNRLISGYGSGMHVVGFAADDGYRRLVDVDAALAAWWRVVRTHDFDEAGFTTLFARLIERRGLSVTPAAARAAGELLAATPGEGQLRNARLAAYLADLALDAARRRLGADSPTVDVADLPPLQSAEPDPDSHSNGNHVIVPHDPLAEMGPPRPG